MTPLGFDPTACLEYLDRHRRVFGVTDLYPLEHFTAMIRSAEDCTLECSCKVSGTRVHPARFNLWFQNDERPRQAALVFDFFREVASDPSTVIDYGVFPSFYTDDFDWRSVQAFVTGVDLRAHRPDSRLKIWFKLGDYAEKIEAAFRLAPRAGPLRQLLVGAGLLVGFDFHLDGRTAIKLYPRVMREQLLRPVIRERLGAVLPDAVLAAMDQCRWVHISLDKVDVDRIVHFRPLDPVSFLQRYLANETAAAVAEYYRQIHVFDTVVSMRESEFLAGVTKNVNLYFMVGRALAVPHAVAAKVKTW